MKKLALLTLVTLSTTIAFAGPQTPSDNDVLDAEPCALEGQRHYIPNAQNPENTDVYRCEKGVWTYFFTQTPDDWK